MRPVIYIKSLHRPYNQNLNSVKWVCKFIQTKAQNNDKKIPKSEFYIEFYIYLIKRLYNYYTKDSADSLPHGVPSFDLVKKSYEAIIGKSREKKKQIINNALTARDDEFKKSIFSSYKAASYFINLAKEKLNFVDSNNQLTETGELLVGFRSSTFKLSKKEKEILFYSIIKSDFHFFISLLLLQKIHKKVPNLSIEEIHFEFLEDKLKVKHFRFTEASNEKNFDKVREYWINDLGVLDKNLNLRKSFLRIIIKAGFELEYNLIRSQIEIYYKERIVPKSKLQRKTDVFLKLYRTSPKNELGFLSLQEMAEGMKMGRKSFQDFLSGFYEAEKNKYNIFFNNIVQAISGKTQYFIRNRPVVNIRIKELNK